MPGILLIGGAVAENKEGMIYDSVVLLFQWGRWIMSEKLNLYIMSFSILMRPMKKNRTERNLRATKEIRGR